VICKPLEIHAAMSKPTKVVTSATPPQGRHAPDRDLRHEGSATTSTTVKMSTAMTKAGPVMVITPRIAAATI